MRDYDEFIKKHGEKPCLVLSKLHGTRASRGRAWNKFLLAADNPITPAAPNETDAEAAVRVYTDMLARCKMFDAAGLRFVDENGFQDTWNLLQMLERKLEQAQADVRRERGQF